MTTHATSFEGVPTTLDPPLGLEVGRIWALVLQQSEFHMSLSSELRELSELHEAGALTDSEFSEAKRAISQ